MRKYEPIPSPDEHLDKSAPPEFSISCRDFLVLAILIFLCPPVALVTAFIAWTHYNRSRWLLGAIMAVNCLYMGYFYYRFGR